MLRGLGSSRCCRSGMVPGVLGGITEQGAQKGSRRPDALSGPGQCDPAPGGRGTEPDFWIVAGAPRPPR